MKRICITIILISLSAICFSEGYLVNSSSWPCAWSNVTSPENSCDNNEATYANQIDGTITYSITYDLKCSYSIKKFKIRHLNYTRTFYVLCAQNCNGPFTLISSGQVTTGVWKEVTFNSTKAQYWKIDISKAAYNEPGALSEIGFYAEDPNVSVNNSNISSPSPFCPFLTAKPSLAPFYWSTGETTQKISACQTNNYILNNTDTTGIFVSQSHNDSIYTSNGKIYAVYRKGDTVYMGGQFDHLARVTGSGALFQLPRDANTTYMPRVNGLIDLVVPDGVGGWYIAGDFTRVGQDSVKYIAHIRNDKKLDTAFHPLPNGKVKAILLAGNRIYLGGNFTKIGDVTRGYLVMIDRITGAATSWDPAANGPVNGIILDGDKVYAGGSFTSLGGQARNYLGSLDTTFALATTWNPAPNAAIRKLVYNAGKLYVVGDFSTISGLPRARLASYTLATGLLDTWSPNPDAVVHDLAFIQNSIYVCGGFHNIGGGVRNWIASVNNTNGNVSTWVPVVNDTVFALGVSGNLLFAGGRFSSVNTSGTPAERYKLCSFDFTNAGQVTAWSPHLIGTAGFIASVKSIGAFGNYIYAGGNFFGAKCGWRSNAAAINAVTGQALDWNPTPNNKVRAILAVDNFLYLGGDFTQIYNPGTNSTIPRNRIVQLQVSTGNVTGWNPNADGSVLTMAAKGAYIYVGGTFLNIGNNPRPRLSAVKISDGTSTTWTPSPNDTVKSVIIGGDTLYVGGNFTSISGATRNRVASYTISTMALNSFNPNADNKVNALAFRNNRLYVAGQFETIGGNARKNFASYNVKTNGLQTMNPVLLSNQLHALTIADSAVYAAGLGLIRNNPYYNMINTFVIKPNQTYASKIWHVDPNGLVRTMFLYKDKVYLGGDFTESLNIYQPYFTAVDNFCSVNNFLPVPADTNFCEGDSVPLWAKQGNGYKYQWYKDNILIAGATKRYYIPVASGWYKALITDTINYGSLYTNARYVTVTPLASTVITVTGSTTFCDASGQSVTLTAASGTGYTYQWYKNSVLISGATSKNYIANTTGNFYCIVYNSAGCPVESQHVVTNSSGLSPVISLTGSNPFCENTTVSLISNLTAGYFHQWYKDNVKISGSTGVSYLASTAGAYKVRDSISTCAGFSNVMTLTVNPLPGAAGNITGEDTICPSVATAVFSIAPVTNATSYIWTLPTGATGTSSTTSITVTFGAGFTGGNITVKGHNSCGDGTAKSLLLYKGALPSAAGNISGEDTICPGITTRVYSVATISGAQSYIWTLPTGVTGSSSTNAINVTFGAGFTGGNITVKGHNSCGDGTAKSLLLYKGALPSAAGAITGLTTICPSVTATTYSVAAINGAQSYIWTLPTGVTGSSNSNSINVTFGVGFTSGNVTVKGHNSCGDGTTSTLLISKGSIPGSAGAISGPTTAFKGSSGVIYQVNPVSGATSYLWTLPPGSTGTSTSNSISVTFGAQAASGNITVKAQNICGDGPVSTLYVTVLAPPPQFAPVTTCGSKGAPNSAAVSVPITVTGFDSITSLSLRLDYDPTLLTWIGFSNANPTLSGLIVNNVPVSATLRKVLMVWTDINPKTLPANSKIVDLNFTHISGTTLLNWNNESNGGSDCEYADKNGDPLWDVPSSQFYINGDVHLQLGYKVSGNFVYNNTGSTVLDNIKVVLKQNSARIDSANTNTQGYYEFPIVPDNTYTIEGNTTKPWAGVNGTDALKIQRHFAGLELLTEPVRLLAADVNLSNSINGTDALKVKRRFAGLDTSFTRGNWTFAKQVIGGDTVIVSGADVTANFYGLCVGDVNGSNTPSPGKSLTSLITLETSGSVDVETGKEFIFPVRIAQDARLGAVSLVLYFPSEFLSVMDISIPGQSITSHVAGNQIRLAWSELDAMALKQNDELLLIRFMLLHPLDAGQLLGLSLGNESEMADGWANPIVCTLSAPTITPSKLYGTDEPGASLQNCMVYPNPATEQLTVEFNLLSGSPVQISLIDLTGKQIDILLLEELPKGYFKRTFHLNALPPGVYTVKINSSGEKLWNYYKKLVIAPK